MILYFRKENPLVYYHLHPDSDILPKLCKASNGLDLPLQHKEIFLPHEVKKVNLGIKFQIPPHYCGLLLNKSSARTQFNVNVQLGLIDVSYNDYLMVVIQNMASTPNILESGIAVAQLLIIPSQIPRFERNWPPPTSSRGGFGSTGQNFEKLSTKTDAL